MRAIEWYIKQGQLAKDNSYKSLANKFLQKARQNLITMSLLSDLNSNKKARELLKVPKEYDSNEWVAICGYYAMYTAALSLLAEIGYRSKNHTATLCVLEEFFVKKKILDSDALLLLKSAMFHKEEIEKLSDARHKREIAQYSITKQTTKTIAEKIKKDAYEFISKCGEILEGK
ncbi:hypothetical protein A3K73_03660 [Candidatus Pacearchaeota archaeon RBG_13_36_9]|nr:MAG: hypothetical protein A3K73_03660 [Candidatus Pacearchaeota archaeon RBG_13_36_9]